LIQIHFGAPWPLSFAALLRAKVSDPTLHRKIALEGHRFTPKEALEAGFVDHIVQGNTAAVLAKAGEIAESVSPLAREGVWGIIKARLEVCIATIVLVLTCRIQSDLYRETLELIARDPRSVNAFVDDAAAKSRL
jgi:enoyl-CoA hydratase/carnithine racemase